MSKKVSKTALGALLLGLVLLVYAAWDGVVYAIGQWSSDEYSYGYFVPFLIAFFGKHLAETDRPDSYRVTDDELRQFIERF